LTAERCIDMTKMEKIHKGGNSSGNSMKNNQGAQFKNSQNSNFKSENGMMKPGNGNKPISKQYKPQQSFNNQAHKNQPIGNMKAAGRSQAHYTKGPVAPAFKSGKGPAASNSSKAPLTQSGKHPVSKAADSSEDEEIESDELEASVDNLQSDSELGSDADSDSELGSDSDAHFDSEEDSQGDSDSSELNSDEDMSDSDAASDEDSVDELPKKRQVDNGSDDENESEQDSEEDNAEENSGEEGENDEDDNSEEESEADEPVAKKAKSTPSNLRETPSGESNACTIFVGNLPYDIEEGRVRQLFKTCGTIKAVRLVQDAKTKRGKGIAYIDFAAKSEHDTAIAKLNGSEVDGRSIRVDAAATTKTFANKTTREPTPILFVGNLAYSVTEKKLQKVFGAFGSVLSVRLPTFSETGKSKGYAYIQFASTADAVKAMQVPRFDLDGRIIRLDYDDGTRMGGTPASSKHVAKQADRFKQQSGKGGFKRPFGARENRDGNAGFKQGFGGSRSIASAGQKRKFNQNN
jgi:nucleolin